MLVQLMGEQDGAELARTLTLALDGDVTFEQDALLYQIAQGQANRFDLRDVEVLVADARLSEPAELGIVGRPTRPGASVLVASSLG